MGTQKQMKRLLVTFFSAHHDDQIEEITFSQLTDWIEMEGTLHWRELNSERLALMTDIREVAMRCLTDMDGLTDTIVMLTNGSDQRCSDMDVAISGPLSAEVCLVMVYCLGVVSKRILDIRTDTISASFSGLQRLLDIELYSSSGVIRAAQPPPPPTCLRLRSGLHEIDNGLYQMVRSRNSPNWFYKVLVSYLWTQITGGTEILRKVRLIVGDGHAERTLDELLVSRSLSRKSRFAIQIAASAESGRIAQLVLATTDDTYRHEMLVRWEHMEALSNTMSPESTVAPATFVDVVLGGQLKMRSHTMLGTRELYLVVLENIGFMETHLRTTTGCQHLCKAYKYAIRCCSAYTRMICTDQRTSHRTDVGWEHMYKWNLNPVVDQPILRKPMSTTSHTRISSSLHKLLYTLLRWSRLHLWTLDDLISIANQRPMDSTTRRMKTFVL
jgi:hypothetical protein